MSSLIITYKWTHNRKSDNVFWLGKCDEGVIKSGWREKPLKGFLETLSPHHTPINGGVNERELEGRPPTFNRARAMSCSVYFRSF
jgi:hypothetical protein